MCNATPTNTTVLEGTKTGGVVAFELVSMFERNRLPSGEPARAIWDFDLRTGKIFHSAALQKIIGLPTIDTTLPIEDWLSRVQSSDVGLWKSPETLAPELFDPALTTDYRVRHEDGTWLPVRSCARAIRDSQGHLERIIGTLTDTTSPNVAGKAGEVQSRAALLQALTEHYVLQKNANRRCAVLVLNFPDLKRIASSCGLETGEHVLVEVARRIQQTLSRELADLLARISDDGFAIFLDFIREEEDALMYGEMLEALLKAPFEVAKKQIAIAVNIGISFGNGQGGPADLLSRAEAAAYGFGTKHNHCVVFSDNIKSQTMQELSLTADLAQAVQAEQLHLHYQPKIDLQSGEVSGFESLCRWSHPVLGNIPPDKFIALAERTGLIVDLGRWALREALQEFSGWREHDLLPDSAALAVNLSARQFSDIYLLEVIKRKLELYGVPPRCLSLEITEGTLIQDTQLASEMLTRLRSLGIQLDLDDFGTGYSCLNYLRRLPFDCLKVDRSFVNCVETDANQATLLGCIINMAHAMNLRVVAEGVETLEQLRIVRELGCDFAQGYLISKPLAREDVPSFLEAWPSRISSLFRS